MTTYNGERFLQEQLDSFLWQTRLPDELVVCDDGSTDRTLEILEAFAQKAPFPVRIYRNPQRLGFSKNFEKAALMCSGELIAFSDQDDVWLLEKLQLVEEAFRKNPDISLCFHDNYVCNENFDKTFYRMWDHYKKATPDFQKNYLYFLKDMSFQGNCLVINNALISIAFPIPSGWAYDQWIPFISILNYPPFFIDKPLIKYRIHPGQTTHHKPMENNLKKILKCINKKNIEKFYNSRYNKWLFAINCYKKNYKYNVYIDINNKIALIENMIKSSLKNKIINIIRFYIKGFYHRYELGARIMVRDLLFTFLLNCK
ncbi:MAG: glycosyltransferase [Desulfobaccales bacterium]